MMKLLYLFNKWRNRSRSKGGRCKFYDNCQWVRKDSYTCLHDDEASMGNSGKPYCGKYTTMEMREKYR